MKLNIVAKSISAIHTLHININIVLYVVQAKKKRMPKSPANLSLKKASSLNWGDLNSIYFLFNSTVTAKNGQAPPAFTGKDQKNIYMYITLSIDFLRDVGNGVSLFLRVARTTHMHQLLKHNVQGQIPCIFLHSIPSNCEQRACCCCQCSPFSRTTQWDIDQGKPRIYRKGFLELNKGKT